MPPGSAYQALILPPPHRSAPPRVISQAPTLPPIITSHAPPASSYSAQSARAAYTPPAHATYSTAAIPPGPVAGGNLSAFVGAKVNAQQQAQRAVQRVQAVEKFAKLLGDAPKLWKTDGGNAFDINPLGKGWSIGRTDMGVDANASVGTPILAPNDSKVVAIQPWGGAAGGQPYELLQLTKGPHAGKFYYVAEQIDHLPPVGSTIKQGQPVARYAPSGTGIEIGYASSTPGQTLAAATTGYSEGQVTPAGQRFIHDFLQNGKAPGSVAPAGSPRVAAASARFVSAITGRQVKPMPVPPVPSVGGTGRQNNVSVIVGAPLSDSQKVFAAELVKKTGLDPGVVAAWVHSEQPPQGLAPNGAHNWLNIGATDSGFYGASNPAWRNPKSAADFTAAWLKGASAPGFGHAAPGIRAILSTAGQGPAAQIAALQNSGWAGSGYPELAQVYNSIRGTARLGTANVNIPAGSSGGAAPSSGAAPGGSAAVSPSGAPQTPSAGAADQIIAGILGGPTGGQTAQQQQQMALLQSFLSGSNPWDIGPKASGFGGQGLSSLLSSSSSDLGSLATRELQKLAGDVPLKKVKF